MGDSEYCCPLCQARLRRVSRRQDFFCPNCHSVVEVLDGEVAIVQRDMRQPETRVAIEHWHPSDTKRPEEPG